MDIIPWIDAGVAVILFTIIIRFILFPLSKKAIVTQVKMREIQPQLNQLKIDYKNDAQTQGTKMMELYKKNGVNPFSSVLLIFIQLPIIYALYAVFIRTGLPVVNESLLYSFVHVPHVNIFFLGLIDITKASIPLSILAAVSQYLQLEFSLNQMKKTVSGKPLTAQADMTQKMTNQMKYIFPVMIFIISYKLSAVLPLYWMTTNIFTLVQELVVRRKLAVQAERPQR
jgi:YidC/Oxa1 family membrane protein insertase